MVCAVKAPSVPPLMLPTSSGIEYEQMSSSAASKKATTASAPMSASSSRSESPMSDRYCGKCSSLISLHLRTIESDGDFTRTNAATQTRPQSKGKKTKGQKQRPSRKSSRYSLDKMETTSTNLVTTASEVSPKRLKR